MPRRLRGLPEPQRHRLERRALGRDADAGRESEPQEIPGGPYTRAVGVGVAIAVGAVLGLALGILVSVATDLPLAPEVGLALGALLGWLSRRGRA